jgi:hypothetical protein
MPMMESGPVTESVLIPSDAAAEIIELLISMELWLADSTPTLSRAISEKSTPTFTEGETAFVALIPAPPFCFKTEWNTCTVAWVA